jgi:hypothetical protein
MAAATAQGGAGLQACAETLHFESGFSPRGTQNLYPRANLPASRANRTTR